MPVYGTDDQRGMKERYSYFVRGRQLVIIEHKLSADYSINNEPSYQAPSGGSDSLAGTNEGKVGKANTLMLEYTAVPDMAELLNESDDVPIHDTMALAIVDYIKAQLAKEFKEKEYFMAKFNKRIAEYANARIGGLRRLLGKGF